MTLLKYFLKDKMYQKHLMKRTQEGIYNLAGKTDLTNYRVW